MSKSDSRQHARKQRAGDRKRLTGRTVLLFLVLLIAPGAALYRISAAVDARILIGYLAAISALAWYLYVRDKRNAQRDEWRIPELNLHFVEFLGGWAAAFVVQRVIRHKISKSSYQWRFWFIILLHQYVAADYALDWRLSQGVLGLLGGATPTA
jgi:uncharacterized membrane protein YsdA (DUF1294 family)